MSEDKEDKSTDDGKIAHIKKLVDDACDYWSENYRRGREDLEFVTVDGAQWSLADQDARKDKPMLTINLLRTYCKQFINTARLNRRQIKVEPVDNKADKKIANIFNGLIKDTEISSSADDAYDAALESAVYSGMGFIRLHADYVSDDSFQQEPKILAIFNAESVYLDPDSKELDGSDARYAVVLSWVPEADLKRDYGNDDYSSFDNGDMDNEWYNREEKTVRIAELFEIKHEKKELYLWKDGTVSYDKPKNNKGKDDDDLIDRKRTVSIKTCRWYKITADKVLEDREFVVPFIPIIPVYGDVTWRGDERLVYSMIHFAKDSQRLYNFWKSSEAEQISEALRRQYIYALEATEGLDEWKNPNAFDALPYNGIDDSNGAPIAPPQLLPQLNALSGILNAADGAKEGMVEIVNMQPAAMGQDVNNQSGKAINLLQQRADVAHFNITDNLNKSLSQAGRILIAMYQVLYSAPMVKRITGEDDKTQIVNLNQQEFSQPSPEDAVIDGILNDITVGRYDIRMTTGTSYISQRQEGQAALTELIRVAPQIAQVAPDLIVKALDNSGMFDDLIERLQKTLPPGMADEGENPQIAAVMQQYQAQMQELQAALQQAQAAANDSEKERQLKYMIEELKSDTQIKVAMIRGHDAEDLQKLKGEFELIKQGMQLSQSSDLNYQNEPPPNIKPEAIPQPPQEGGFLLPENMQQQEYFAPNDVQIGENVPMDAMQQPTELDSNQG